MAWRDTGNETSKRSTVIVLATTTQGVIKYIEEKTKETVEAMPYSDVAMGDGL